jgi:hypothetical protein
MLQYAIKVLLTAVIIVTVAELAKRGTWLAALLASLPLTSLLAFVWLYLDTGSTAKVAELSQGIFWLVLPSLVMLLLLPALLRMGWGFWTGLGASASATALAYLAMAWALRLGGIKS